MRVSTIFLLALIVVLVSISTYLYLENQLLLDEIGRLRHTIVELQANASGCRVCYERLDKLDQELKACRRKLSSLDKELASLSTRLKLLNDTREVIDKYERKISALRKELYRMREEYWKLRERYNRTINSYKRRFNEVYENYMNFIHKLMRIENEILSRTFIPIGKKLFDYDSKIVREFTRRALDGCTSGLQCVKKLGMYILKRIKYAPDQPIIGFDVIKLDDIYYYIYMRYYDDYFQKASETLKRKYGDCDDLAILMTTMVLAYKKYYGGKDVIDSFVVMAGSSTIGHAYSITILRNGKAVVFYSTKKGMVVVDMKDVDDVIKSDGFSTLYTIVKYDYTDLNLFRKVDYLERFILENYSRRG